MAYASGLKVKETEAVQKIRRLPISGDILVNQGEIVSFDTVVARTKVKGESISINVASALKVEPQDLKLFMIKKVGDKIGKNELLAKRIEFFGLLKSFCQSPAEGTVELVSDVTGQVVINEPELPIEVTAYIPGRIAQILPKEGVIVETQAAFIQGIFGIGGETHGQIKVVVPSPADILTADLITSICTGKILVGGSMITLEALHKAIGMGVKGIIVGGIREEDLINFLGYEVGVAITGNENIGLTLIITEGFSKIKMASRTFELLKKFEEKEAAINGATQIRAGVIRPEIIIPLGEIVSIKKGDEEISAEGVRPGMRVRVICEPFFGCLGSIVSLPVELQQIETESQVRVFELVLDDGRQVTIPRPNVEIIEE